MNNSNVKKYIDRIRPFILPLFQKDASGHDIGHLERTMETALYIQEKEGGDRIIIGISAYLHDLHRLMQNGNGCYVEPKQSLKTIENILSTLELTDKQINKICYCIEHHEHYNWNGNNVDDLNTLIVQDADNLDAIGAIGICRAFSYGGAHSIPIYDPSIPLNENINYFEATADEASTIHHFFHKLFKLRDNMNTKTAHELASKKTNFMISFVDQFMDEWYSKY